MANRMDHGARGEPAAGPAAGPAADITFESYRPGDEAALVALLNAIQGDRWGDLTWWNWKHRDCPGFRADDIIVGRVAGEVVACLHATVLEVRIAPGLTLPVSFDSDLAVLPARRGQDLGARARDLSSERLRARHVVFRVGFTSRALNENYFHPRFGHVLVPGVTTQYRKHLGPGSLAPRVAELGARLVARPAVRGALRRPLVVDLAIGGFLPCHVVLAAHGFELVRGAAERPDLRARLPYALLASLADGGLPHPRVLLRALGRGELRVGGLLRTAPRLLALALALARSR